MHTAPQKTQQKMEYFHTENSKLKLEVTDDESSDTDAIKYAQGIMGKSYEPKNENISWLVQTIKEVVGTVEEDLNQSQFEFQDTLEAAQLNSEVLKKYEYNFEKAVAGENNSILTPGTEFRKVENIEKIWKHRENWEKIKSILINGCTYPLQNEQDEKTRKKDLEAMVTRGNHKSALTPDHRIVLEKIQKKEVAQGFTFPITVECLMKLEGAAVIPMGVHDQWTVNEEGERFMKPRACNDASFPTPSGYSVNLDHDSDLLSPCIYGQCLRRCLHSIHKMRLKHPLEAIYLTKYDFDAAYRRVHVYPAHAVKTIIVTNDMAYLLSRLPFGVQCGPSEYSFISEGIFDLANDLLGDPTWDPNSLYSPLKSELSTKNVPDRTIPFSTAKELCVDIPFRKATCYGYIDDAILIALDIGENTTRSQNSIPLAAHCIFRPLSKNEPIARNDTVSKRKLQGEGTPDETKVILGWTIDTRLFRIFLPMDKAYHWISDLKILLQEKYRIKSKEIESHIGRLNHVGYIMPHGRFFLNIGDC